jgi:hypothetical protein
VRTGSAVLGFCGSGFVLRFGGSEVLRFFPTPNIASLGDHPQPVMERSIIPGTTPDTQHSAQNLEPQNLRTAVSPAETQDARSSRPPYA